MATQFDYIIVGGGTAGVVIASRLSQYLSSARIALIEAGPNAVHHPKVNDVSDAMTYIELLSEGLVVDYSTTPQEHLNNRQIFNPAGNLLSGSSGVNVGNWMRASTGDHDLIAKRAGNNRFLFKNMVKYLKRLETHFDSSADKEDYGFDGPIHTIGGRKYPMRDIIQQSAESIGHRYNPIATKGDPIGLADFVQCFKATSDGRATRQHSAKVYDLSNVEVWCDSIVARVVLNNQKRAIGVELLSGLVLTATKEVILSCGTQRTPQLLMLSGIGPASELSRHKIPVLVDAPAIGQNLFDHLALTSYYKLKDSSKGYSKPFSGRQQTNHGQVVHMDFSLFASIPSAKISPHLLADIEHAKDHPTLLPRRCHFMSIILYYPVLAHPDLFPGISEANGDHISVAALHMQPLSRGTVNLRSANPRDHPVCDPKLFSTNTDRFIMRTAIRENILLASTSPLADELKGEVAPRGFKALTPESTDEEIDERVRAFAMTFSHPMGTCALGTVLDDEFRVKGVEGLRVCDASVFPEPIGAMPSCTVYALGEMCAELLAGMT